MMTKAMGGKILMAFTAIRSANADSGTMRLEKNCCRQKGGSRTITMIGSKKEGKFFYGMVCFGMRKPAFEVAKNYRKTASKLPETSSSRKRDALNTGQSDKKDKTN